MSRRPLRLARLALILLVVASVLGPALVLFGARFSGPSALAGVATTVPRTGGTAVQAVPGPWFSMNVLAAQRDFRLSDSPPLGAPPVPAFAGILVDIDTGEILWAKDPHKALPPASMTKILTALVALENFSPDQLITVTPDSLHQYADETTMGLRPHERLTLRELLEGMLLVSGNDAATAIANDTVGQLRFVAAMNAQVDALGLHDSHFTTPVGLSDPAQFASPYDLAVIAAVTYDAFALFRQIVATVDLNLPANTAHRDYFLHNLDQLLQKYPAAVGIKPGFTYDAGPCLVGMAVRHGHRLVAVLMHAAYPAAVEARLLDWGFAVEGLPRLLPQPKPSPSPTPAGH